MQKNNIGEQLYKLRIRNGLSQDELAEKLDVTRQTISNWENNKAKIDIVTASEICDLYHICLDELVGNRCENGNKGEGCSVAKEENPSCKKEKSSDKKGRMLLSFSLILSLFTMTVGGLLFAVTQGKETSSVIRLTSKGGAIAVIVCGAAVLVVTLIYMIREYFKK